MTVATTVKTPIAVPTEMLVLARPLLSVVPVGVTVTPAGAAVSENDTWTPGAGKLLESTTLNVTVACSLKPDPRKPMMVQFAPPHRVETQLTACTLTIGKFSVAIELEGTWEATIVAMPGAPLSRNWATAFPSAPVVELTVVPMPPSGKVNPPRFALKPIV